MDFGNVLRKIRRNHKLTQQNVAEIIGKTSMYISGIESGKNGPLKEEDLRKIYSGIDLTMEEREYLEYATFCSTGRVSVQIVNYLLDVKSAYRLLKVLSKEYATDSDINRLLKYYYLIKNEGED